MKKLKVISLILVLLFVAGLMTACGPSFNSTYSLSGVNGGIVYTKKADSTAKGELSEHSGDLFLTEDGEVFKIYNLEKDQTVMETSINNDVKLYTVGDNDFFVIKEKQEETVTSVKGYYANGNEIACFSYAHGVTVNVKFDLFEIQYDKNDVSFYEYFKIMVLPAAVAGLSALIVLLLIFRKSLLSESAPQTADKTENFGSLPVRINLPSMIAALVALGGCIAALAVSDIIGVEMWIISVGFAAALSFFNIVYGIIRGEGLLRAASGIRKSPWELVPFVLSMFVIVSALAKSGALAKLSSLLIGGDKTDGLTFGFLTAGLSNLLNNIPASVVMEKIIAGKSLAATFGAVIGTNIGAFITPVGALAGIMWNKILSGYGIKLPFYKFALYGILVAFVSLSLSLLTLFLIV